MLAVVILAVGAMVPVDAVSTPDRRLGISPLRNELTITPGTSFDGKLTLTNSGQESLAVTMNAEVFSVINEAYDYSFNPSGKEVAWVTFGRKQVTVAAGTSETVSYKIAVPLDAEPGGRYLSLFASSQTNVATTGVTAINRVASLLYITVAGNVTRTGTLLSLNSPFLTFEDPTWTATVQNSGTTHFHSIYSVSVTPVFGGASVKSAQGDSLILPSSIRLLSQSIPRPDILGIYRLDYTVGLGDVAAYQATKWMLYVPPLQSLLVLAIIIGIFFLFRPKRQKPSK